MSKHNSNNKQLYLLLTILSFLLKGNMVFAQPELVPLNCNPVLRNYESKNFNAVSKTTALSIPFFEDFTGSSPIPDETKWVERQVYINNTMCDSPISRGVATFDAIDQNGLPYNKSFTALDYGDTLTSQPIDLSGKYPVDSVYFSFFYQAQGLGFAPEPQDSLMLYFKKSGSWHKVWSVPGSTLTKFSQVMISLVDSGFYHNAFQFRFINKVSININDDVWNVDYIRLASNRTLNDTLINDIAFTTEPSFILNDYTSMPYRHFINNQSGERSSTMTSYVHDNYTASQNTYVGYYATAINNSGKTALWDEKAFFSIPASSTLQSQLPSYNNTVPIQGIYDRVVFENKYYIQSVSTSDPAENDTIVCNQVFDNYLAYDDGTAEKSYFLHLTPSLPGKTAVDFHLNRPDSLKGVAIYFGRQVPLASYKYFSIVVYSDIAFNGGADNILYQQDFLQPGYGMVNNYWVYKLDSPVPLPSGRFYIGIIQPALSGSDSLYLGWDANRTGANHVYYNVLSSWQGFNAQGALMVHPLLGQDVFPSGIKSNILKNERRWSISPNPVKDKLVLHYELNQTADYMVTDLQGRIVKTDCIKAEQEIDMTSLMPGMYFIRITVDGVVTTPKKIIKL